jgi:thiol-disulfide isomerase/thioredoxin
MSRLYLTLLLLFTSAVDAYESLEIELDTGSSLSINQFKGAGKSLIIWLPSERGLGQGYIPISRDLAAMDIDVWAANLHESYIIPAGRDSLNEIDMDDLLALIDVAQSHDYAEIYLLTTGRGAQLALKLAYLWQLKNPQSSLLRGLLLFSPHLVQGRTEMGKDARYVEISAYSNLPVYMLLPQYSTKFARGVEIAHQLGKGGSQVYMHTLKGVHGGFHMRPEEDLKAIDISTREQLAQIVESALGLLSATRIQPVVRSGYQLVEHLKTESDKPKTPSLHPYLGDSRPHSLVLNDLNGNRFDLAESSDEVVLVNFWATWCRPCVEEVPSLSRLVARMKGRPFRVVAVNIGESPEDIKQFTESIPVNFDILLDQDGRAVREWKVYAYPSNYLIDRKGNIRFAYRGALEWDALSVINKIESLL